jgi:hypothetical protein
VYRYLNLEKIPFPENLNNIVFSDICTNRGDKISIRPDQDIALNVLNPREYEGIVLFKDGNFLSIQAGSLVDWELTELTTGKYVAILYKNSDDPYSLTLADATETNSTSFIVCDVKVSRAAIDGTMVRSNYTYTAEPIDGEYPIPAQVTIKKSTGITVHAHLLNNTEFTGTGTVEIEIGSSYVKGGENQAAIIHVPFKTEYGFVIAENGYDNNPLPKPEPDIEPEDPPEPTPAEDYTTLEYITGAGNAYIDTGIKASDYSNGL